MIGVEETAAQVTEKRLPWKGLIRVCAWCKRMLDEEGVWGDPRPVPREQSVTHGICPECLEAETPGGSDER